MGILSEVQDKAAKQSIKNLKTKTPTLNQEIQNLSGGNQQKVLIARWLLTNPDILILDEPTRGIDVGAKYEIYSIMIELAKRGKSIIMISSEMPELLGISDRIMVMCEGRVTGVLDKDEADEVKIMNYSTKFIKKIRWGVHMESAKIISNKKYSEIFLIMGTIVLVFRSNTKICFG